MDTPRQCGECTLCCFTHGIPTLDKERLHYCQHCMPGVGCHIYETRPDECRDFTCLWLEDYGTVNERPDKVQIVINLSLTVIGHMIIMVGTTPEAFDSAYAQRASAYFAKRHMPILRFHRDGKRELVLLKGAAPIGFLVRQAQREKFEIVFVDGDH